MKKFSRRRGVLTTGLSAYEVELLTSLVRQVVELVSDGEPEGFATVDAAADPFEALAADLSVDPDDPEVPEDPVLRRLFPNAYPHDAAASSDFRRFTEQELRSGKAHNAGVVIESLEAAGLPSELEELVEQVDVELDQPAAMAWLKALTDMRLAIATRLGVEEDDEEHWESLPDDDPGKHVHDIYDWLGFIQETLVRAVSR